MKTIKSLFILGLILIANQGFGQKLPDNYEAIFNELIDNMELIRSGNSVKKGKSTLTVFNEKKIVLRMTYNKQVKNLTFIKEADDENKMVWKASNQLTADMVDRHEEDLTEELMKMLEETREKAKE